jgi:nicotinamide-nucleotide amidase
MAQGVRKTFHTTFGLSTTGVAGPTGGTKRSPVGRVFIGIAKGNRTWVKKLDLRGTRREIKRQAGERSLEFLRKILIEELGSNLQDKNFLSPSSKHFSISR